MITESASLIATGRRIADKLSAHIETTGHAAATEFRAQMSADDRTALNAFRDHQLATLVGSIEDSPVGADIRFEEAKKAYAEIVAAGIAASIKE